jgi:glycosyltransferase involved in cell wall biosynthesis
VYGSHQERDKREMDQIKMGWLGRYSAGKDTLFGGKAYEKQLLNFLSENYDIEEVYPHSRRKGLLKWLEELYSLSKLRTKKDLFIRDFYSSAIIGRTDGLNLSIIHHIDTIDKEHPFLNKLLEKRFYKNLDRIDIIVTVSNFWKRYFEERGHQNVKVIHNGFDLKEFEISEEDVDNFKVKYGLEGKPIIYLGNARPGKGVAEAYQELKDRDAYLVTSGEERVKTPAINLNLNHREYLTLLKASSVVIVMSKFKEGWNRTAHEAMLCKTPVVGSGKGGMRELLEGGKQIICEDISKLNQHVDIAIGNREESGGKGYMFAKDFTVERFEKEWERFLSLYF